MTQPISYQQCQQIAEAILALNLVPVSGTKRAQLLYNVNLLQDYTKDPAARLIAGHMAGAISRGQRILHIPQAT